MIKNRVILKGKVVMVAFLKGKMDIKFLTRNEYN